MVEFHVHEISSCLVLVVNLQSPGLYFDIKNVFTGKVLLITLKEG